MTYGLVWADSRIGQSLDRRDDLPKFFVEFMMLKNFAWMSFAAYPAMNRNSVRVVSSSIRCTTRVPLRIERLVDPKL